MTKEELETNKLIDVTTKLIVTFLSRHPRSIYTAKWIADSLGLTVSDITESRHRYRAFPVGKNADRIYASSDGKNALGVQSIMLSESCFQAYQPPSEKKVKK